jgi:uncharacterized LabA/DUF88 family protein
VYVDGTNLQHGILSGLGPTWLWLDVVLLAQRLRPRSDVAAIRYFTARMPGAGTLAQHQLAYLDAISAWSGMLLSLELGRYERRSQRCAKCRDVRSAYVEKQTDVNIASALVSDAAQNLMDAALVVCGDTDLAPAMHAARAATRLAFVAAAFPPRRYSKELQKGFPASFRIPDALIRGAQLPDEFEAGGVVHRRPVGWGGAVST